jgi:hypothetical protein
MARGRSNPCAHYGAMGILVFKAGSRLANEPNINSACYLAHADVADIKRMCCVCIRIY